MPVLVIYHSQITEHDVLCGRGGLTNHHMGNRRFRSIVADHQGEYMLAKKHDKADIARRIVGIIKETGGRFLKSIEGKAASGQKSRWEEVGDKKAREKTSQALREGLDVRHSRFAKPKNPATPTKEEAVSSGCVSPIPHAAKRKRGQDAEARAEAMVMPLVKCEMTSIESGSSNEKRCDSPALISEVGSVAGSDDYDPLFFLPFDFDYGETVTHYELDLPKITETDYENVTAV